MTCACAHPGLPDGGCDGRLQWHHVLPKQRLKQMFRYGAVLREVVVPSRWEAMKRNEWTGLDPARTLVEILADPRNREWLCARHHELVEKHTIPHPPPSDSVREFCAEYGLEGWLERYTRQEAA